MNVLWRQSRAIAWSECLRMATSPAWSILLFLWTLVCSLFFQIVINYAAANALPAGETPMSYFFRTAPFLLPLLLIVFVPQLTMDVVAGRRERGRMQHLLISGVKPAALIIGAYMAICLLLTLLLIPPLLFHAVVAIHAQPDIGKTISALMHVYIIGACVAALGLAVSCWAPSRLSAGLISVSIGIAWWIIDLFGGQIDQTDSWESWRNAAAMGMAIYDGASGLIEPRLLINFILLSLCLLFIGRCGLDYLRFPFARCTSAIMALIITLSVIAHTQHWNNRWDWTAYNIHSVNSLTEKSVHSLVKEGGIHVTLSASPDMRSDPLYAPVYERCRHLFQRLEQNGLQFTELDPAMDPHATVQLSRECDIEPQDWRHPLVIVKHLDRHVILRIKQLAIYEQRDTQLKLQALHCEGALLAAVQYLSKGRHLKIAWLHNDHTRAINLETLQDRNRSLESAFKQLQSNAYAVTQVQSIQQFEKNTELPDVFILPGLIKDLTHIDRGILNQMILNNCSVCVLLDGERSKALPELQQWLKDYGITYSSGIVKEIINPDLKQIRTTFPSYMESESPPFGLLYREKRMYFQAHTLLLAQTKQASQEHTPAFYFNSRYPITLASPVEAEQLLAKPHGFLAISQAKDQKHGDLAVIGSVDNFSDAFLHRGSNTNIWSLLHRHLSKQVMSNELPPQAVQSQRFTLSSTQRLILTWLIGVGLPCLSAALGAFIAIRRRRVA